VTNAGVLTVRIFAQLLLWLDGACVSVTWRGASALNIAQIGTLLRFFR
jgi:hypothetical protein